MVSDWLPWPLGLDARLPLPQPYDYNIVWLMRDEWDRPAAANPREMDPLMNVSGLWWRPWTPPTIEVTASEGGENG